MARLFQSTQPSQAVTIDRVDALKDSYEFQSTQPSQAVTKEIETLSAYIKISIRSFTSSIASVFQSTQPSQAVTINTWIIQNIKIFQSTQPSQAVTLLAYTHPFSCNISIHTALAGCD